MIEAIHDVAAGSAHARRYSSDDFPRAERRNEDPMRHAADEVYHIVQNRLPGRIRELAVRVEGDRFILSGISRSYYVKQVAQHVAMSALDAAARGRLVNQIEVRTVR